MKNGSKEEKIESRLYPADSEFVEAIREEFETFLAEANEVQKSMHAIVDRMDQQLDQILLSMSRN